jgi:hypothetical protein
MPRARRTQSGAPAQAHTPVPNQPYGTGVEHAALADAAPAPDGNGAGQRMDPSAAGLRDIAQGFPMPAAMPLSAPSGRPDEPVTTGMASGPGAGREALMNNIARPNRRAEILEALASTTSDPRLQRLAERARLTG